MATNIIPKRAPSHATVGSDVVMPSPVNGVEMRDELTGAAVAVVPAKRNSARLKFGDASDNTQGEGGGNASVPKHLKHDAIDPSADKKQIPTWARRAHGMLHAKGLQHTLNVGPPRDPNGQRDEENPDCPEDQSAKSLTIGGMNMAVAFDAVVEEDCGEDETAVAAALPSRRGDDRFEGEHGMHDLLSAEGTLPAPESRVEYLAMVAAPGRMTLALPQLRKTTGLRALRLKSHVECERRCGSDGFCDPSDERGCGGEFCIRLKLKELF